MNEFNVRDIIRNNVNKSIYKGLIKNNKLVYFKNNLLNQDQLLPTRINGGNNDNGDSDNEMKFKIEDTFVKYNTNSILFGKTITQYAKDIIFNVIKYYNSKDINGNTDLKQRIIKYLNKLFNDKELNYDKLMQKFNAQTNECLLGYMLIAYQNENLDLMLRTMYTFGRVLPLDYKTEWFDNYRLNAYGNVLNMVMWKKYDSNDVYTIDEEPKPINKSVQLPFNKVVKYMVGSLRAFIIDYDLYPNKLNTQLNGGDIEAIVSPNDYHKIKEMVSDGGKNKTAEEICDECYTHYPFYFGGSHGCDVFSLGMTLTIKEIKMFLDRYPSARIGYILNTATYRSGKGEHWVALEFTQGRAKLICSQQSDFSVFHDSGVLRRSIHEICYGEEWNNRLIHYKQEINETTTFPSFSSTFIIPSF